MLATLGTASDFEFDHLQGIGSNKVQEAMEEAGFEEITVVSEPVAFCVSPTFGYRELFTYMASCTPADVRIAAHAPI